MGWKGTFRAMEAAERRAQREAQRRYRELQRQAKEDAKLSALERARLEVQTFEAQLEALLSVHKDRGQEWDWEHVLEGPPPAEPIPTRQREEEVAARMAAYQPGFFEKLLGKAKKQEQTFAYELHVAKDLDHKEFQAALTQYELDRAECEKERKLAAAVLAGDVGAYAQVLRELSPFAELSELGSSLNFRIHSRTLLEALVKVNGQQAIPAEVKSLTSSGKVSAKGMPKARFHEVYQDYVCGCVLRVARELFALLPLQTVIVTASADLFDSRTGRTAEQAILSVAIPQSVLKKLNFDRLDPSDSMENFLHRGDFKATRKSGAFVAITPLSPADVELPATASTVSAPSLGSARSVAPSVNPFPAKWAEALRKNEIQCGFLRLTANELAELLGRRSQDSFSAAESKAMARAVEGFGYCLEPDPRHGAGNFWGNREVGVFQPPSGTIREPSLEFLGASALLQLCLLVAAADGTVDRNELDQFRRFIEDHFRFPPDEHQRLVVLETLLTRDSSAARVTLDRTAKRLPRGKHIVIAQFLVDVAAADGVVSPAEHKALRRIFEALSLGTDTLDALIRNLGAIGGEVVIRSGGIAASGESLQLAGVSPEPGGLQLDMSRVAAISAETSEVIGLLAAAMTEEIEERGTPEQQPTVAPATLAVAEISTIDRLGPDPAGARINSLDTDLHAVVTRLASRNSWSRAEFEDLARDHQFMPLSVFDRINEWADEHLGDFLLEGIDPIIVNRALLVAEP